jgi:hypothetical protein
MKGSEVAVTFDNIPSGAAVFIDANCLVYEAPADPTYGPAGKRLLGGVDGAGAAGGLRPQPVAGRALAARQAAGEGPDAVVAHPDVGAREPRQAAGR